MNSDLLLALAKSTSSGCFVPLSFSLEYFILTHIKKYEQLSIRFHFPKRRWCNITLYWYHLTSCSRNRTLSIHNKCSNKWALIYLSLRQGAGLWYLLIKCNLTVVVGTGHWCTLSVVVGTTHWCILTVGVWGVKVERRLISLGI